MTIERDAAGRRGSALPLMLFLVAIGTSAFVWWTVALPVLAGSLGSHAAHAAPVHLHAVGGTLMLLAGSAAIYIGWTRRGFQFHKWVGYGYLVGGATASISALALNAVNPHADMEVALATSGLAVAWLAVSAMGWRAVRNRRIETHREWMIRSYVLTWTFVFCRIVQSSELGLVPESLVADVIWATWVAPLVICEIVLQWRRGGAQQRL